MRQALRTYNSRSPTGDLRIRLPPAPHSPYHGETKEVKIMPIFAQSVAHLEWEARAIHALRRHLIVVIPVATFFLKIVVQFFSRDDWKEILKSLSNLPLELMFISMSFMLGALSGLSPSYGVRFGSQGDADLYAALVICAIFALCLAINFLTRFLRKLFGKLLVAHKQLSALLSQPRIPETVPGIAISGRIIWATVYCTLTALVLSLTLGISIGSLV